MGATWVLGWMFVLVGGIGLFVRVVTGRGSLVPRPQTFARLRWHENVNGVIRAAAEPSVSGW
jgi:hypothetical protein